MLRTRAVLVLVLALTVGLTGCVDSFDAAVERVRGTPPPPKDFTTTFDDHIEPDYEASHEFPVEANARLVKVEAELDMRSDAPLPGSLGLAQAEFAIMGPGGDQVGDVITLTPDEPSGNLTVREPGAEGTYTLRVTGRGLSNGEQGAAYDAIVLVKY